MRLLDRMRDVGEFFSFSPRVARALGGPEEGLFFLFLFWRQRDEFDEVCVSAEEVEEATALTRRRQERIRKNLKESGVLIEDYRGLPARIYYRIDHDRFEDVWMEWARSHRGSTNRKALHVENVEQRFDDSLGSGATKSRTIPLSEERSRTATEREALREEKKQEPRTKAQAQPTLSLTAAAPTKIDQIALLRGDHDSRRDRPVLEATVALWASVWSRNPALAAVTKDRERVWRDATKTYPPSAFAKAIIGMWWDPSPADRTKFHEFTHVARALETWVGLYDQHGDPRDRFGFRPGCPTKQAPVPGGGRGGDRAYGGSGEAVGTEVVLAQVRERERLEAIEREKTKVTPEEARADLEYADQLLRQARKATRGGER